MTVRERSVGISPRQMGLGFESAIAPAPSLIDLAGERGDELFNILHRLKAWEEKPRGDILFIDDRLFESPPVVALSEASLRVIHKPSLFFRKHEVGALIILSSSRISTDDFDDKIVESIQRLRPGGPVILLEEKRTSTADTQREWRKAKFSALRLKSNAIYNNVPGLIIWTGYREPPQRKRIIDGIPPIGRKKSSSPGEEILEKTVVRMFDIEHIKVLEAFCMDCGAKLQEECRVEKISERSGRVKLLVRRYCLGDGTVGGLKHIWVKRSQIIGSTSHFKR